MMNHKRIADTNWLLLLTEGDKIDIFGELNYWYVGVIKQIQKSANEMKFKMLIDYSYQFGPQTILIDTNDANCMQLIKPFGTKSRYHHDMGCIGCIYSLSKSYSCEICKRECCSICFAVTIYDKIRNKLVYECHDCLSISQYKYLFNLIKLIYDSIFRDTNSMIDINIIPLITNYSFTYVSQCHNQIKCCSNIVTINISNKLQNKMMKYIDYNYKITHFTRRELLFICDNCCESRTTHELIGKYSQCKVFHDNILHCVICESDICTKCTSDCKGIDCKHNKYYCDKCWISMQLNKCVNYKKCLNILCNKCYILSICDRCKYPICSDCKHVWSIGTSMKMIYVCQCCVKMRYYTKYPYKSRVGLTKCSQCCLNIKPCTTIGCRNNYCDHLVQNNDGILVTMSELLLELSKIFKVGKIEDLIRLQSQLYELKSKYNPPHMLHNTYDFDSDDDISDIE